MKEPASNTQILPPDLHAMHIRTLGVQIIRETAQTSLLYIELCSYIRSHQLPRKLVAFELNNLGFAKSRISEINAVANSPDAVWAQYTNKAIGFKHTLALTREHLKPLTPHLEDRQAQLITDVVSSAESSHNTRTSRQQTTRATPMVALNKAAISCLKLACKVKRPAKTYHLPDPDSNRTLTLTISVRKSKAPTAPTKDGASNE